MTPERKIAIEENIRRLRSLAPDRKNFADEDQYQEAVSGFRHRIGPSIQYGETLLKRSGNGTGRYERPI